MIFNELRKFLKSNHSQIDKVSINTNRLKTLKAVFRNLKIIALHISTQTYNKINKNIFL